MKKAWFIASFVLSLTAPTLLYPLVKDHLDQTNYENRTLASFPELSLANLEQIPVQFEAFYNDHVPFKNLFVRAKTKIDLELLGESSVSTVTVGKDNWLFYTVEEKGEDALADYQKTNLYTDDEIAAIGGQIRDAKEWLGARGIRFFVFEAPNKETIYGEYMPDKIKTYGEQSRLDQAIPQLREMGLPIRDLKPALLEAKESWQIYYKYDTHWNQLGSFVGSQEIAQALTGSSIPLSDLTVVESGTCSGDMARMLNLAGEYSDDVEYVIADYLPEIQFERTEENDQGTFAVFESNAPNDRTLLLVGDSFSQGLKYYLPKLYQTSVFATFDTYESWMLDRYQPDDFVYLTVERNQDKFERIGEIVKGGTAAAKAGETEEEG